MELLLFTVLLALFGALAAAFGSDSRSADDRGGIPVTRPFERG